MLVDLGDLVLVEISVAINAQEFFALLLMVLANHDCLALRIAVLYNHSVSL